MSKCKSNFLLRCLLTIFFGFCFSAYSPSKNSPSINYDFKSDKNQPDYNNLNYWAAQPFKKDPSDNVPEDLIKESIDSIADVFFIHPTTYTDSNLPMGWNADNNAELNRKTDNSTILYQASVFNKYCRVFAPRYRQANLQAFFTDDSVLAKKSFDMAYEDISASFEYYLKNLNKGRPIIIASHSQGTLHAQRLLKEFFEGKPLQKQLVCAYIIGLPVFSNYFSTLKSCND